MRTVLRLCLVGALVASVGLAAVPIAEAKKARTSHHADAKQNKKIRKAKRKANRAHARIENLKEWGFVLDDHNRRQDASFNTLQGLVNAIIAGVPDIVGGLEALEEGLLALQAALEDDVGPALEAIDAALNDETTGLVGLNLARPQFGVFGGDGTFLGGTGTVASGPSDDAAHPATGTYIVDFGNDVADRALVFTAFPTGGAPLVGSPVNCASDTSGTCTGVLGAGDHPDQVLVIVQNSTTAALTDGTFQIMAISG